MKRYWFKAKNYGWGWYPATWEGWLTLGIYLVILWTIITLTKEKFGDDHFIVPYITSVTTLTAILIMISYRTGEKPEWRWGKKKPTKKR